MSCAWLDLHVGANVRERFFKSSAVCSHWNQEGRTCACSSNGLGLLYPDFNWEPGRVNTLNQGLLKAVFHLHPWKIPVVASYPIFRWIPDHAQACFAVLFSSDMFLCQRCRNFQVLSVAVLLQGLFPPLHFQHLCALSLHSYPCYQFVTFQLFLPGNEELTEIIMGKICPVETLRADKRCWVGTLPAKICSQSLELQPLSRRQQLRFADHIIMAEHQVKPASCFMGALCMSAEYNASHYQSSIGLLIFASALVFLKLITHSTEDPVGTAKEQQQNQTIKVRGEI